MPCSKTRTLISCPPVILSNMNAPYSTTRTLFPFLLVFSFFTTIVKGQDVANCHIADDIIVAAQTSHYAPRDIDSNFSVLVYEEFISSINSGQQFFTSSDLEKLEVYKYTAGLGGEKTCDFISLSIDTYKSRFSALAQLLDETSKSPISFSGNDEYRTFDKEELTNQNWKSYWKSYFKMNVLFAIIGARDSTDLERTPSAEEIDKWKYQVGQNMICRFENTINSYGAIDQYITDKFLKSVAHAFDPHTTLYSMADFKQFATQLSKNTMTYGIEVYRNEAGEIEIYNILPGSPAWNSNDINTGDIIIGTGAKGVKPTDFTCMSTADVQALIETSDSGEATFHLRKKSGDEVHVTLRQSIVEVQSNIIQSYLLEGERKLGYLYLPSFYEGEGNSGCATDVGKALIQLKREGVEGLILDLRDNGGGSMEEAIRLSGIFINYGALSILSASALDQLETLKDMDRGVLFDKPMVILVNEYSASASELFAAAMQDRNRAIIVGNSTFGKSTAQRILPLTIRNENGNTVETDPYVIKITFASFYRVTGQTHQGEGVQPDIALPSQYSGTRFNESSYPSALSFEPVTKKTYYFPADPLPIEALKELSTRRIQNDSDWTQYISVLSEEQEEKEDKSVPLNYEAFYQSYMDTTDREEFFIHLPENLPYSVAPARYTMRFTSVNEDENERNIRSISNDPWIAETYQILNDYLLLNTN
ncbi:MAG: hypothetical protein EP346_03435 [Bacteroidetes bacterium]|nr:MAG: hypothetical protein EP346_03435 [Bacteroidota bacterium]